MEITCKECGNVFEGRGNAKYCSDKCRKVGYAKSHRKAQRTWINKNPDYWQSFYKELLIKNPTYFSDKMAEYEPRTNNVGIGSSQYVSKADWSTKASDGGLTAEQRKQLDDIKRLKRLAGLE